MLGALALTGGSFFAIDALVGEALAGTIEDLRASKTLRLAYDPDAPPSASSRSPPNAEPLFPRALPGNRRQAQGAAQDPRPQGRLRAGQFIQPFRGHHG
jgi:hypothetical protein